ncbi:MAG: response regulator transcription factor [Lachnospiraceae bacterium]|nr:response regulator transcription factor [Lachnospiraceae bacterium]MCI9400068.1 response regulator transcription factor [Lachnospiraceae bacterium]MCX4376862.1 LytTR family DNA-binding domain-containing protein [Lachnospiraceae bacterium]
MLLIAVCDDIPIECADIAKQIETILKQSNTDFMIKKFFGGLELIQSRESFDIIFLDIKMPNINGMELAKQIRKQGRQSLIIFITSASEYVFDAFDVEAFQYLLKPIQTDKLKNVLEKATKKMQIDANIDFLMISANRQIQKVFLKDILYIESIGRIAKIHCNNGTLETYEQIGILEDKLSDKFFFRCHKCFLVNLNFVDAFNKTEVRLENGEKIMLAKRRYEDFQKAILSYMKIKGGII